MSKWKNGKKVYTLQQTAVVLLLQSQSQCPSMHSLSLVPRLVRGRCLGTRLALTERSSLPDSWDQRVCNGIASRSACFTFGSLLPFLVVESVYTLFRLYTMASDFEASSCSCLHCFIFVSHTALLFKTAHIIQMLMHLYIPPPILSQ